MERIRGNNIEDYIKANPESINALFAQAIDAFSHLESNDILHRDIRPQNILISNDGTLKLIDFGFGKIASRKQDFDKSISINWWCEPPDDFEQESYSHCTEIYFLGKLFEKLIHDYDIDSFKQIALLREMNRKSPEGRIGSFSELKNNLLTSGFDEVNFSDTERSTYQSFSNTVCHHIVRMHHDTKYRGDVSDVLSMLEFAYKNFMLEVYVPNSSVVISCFIDGEYRYRPTGMEVATVKSFIDVLRAATVEKKRIILANLHTKFNTITRTPVSSGMDDVPF